MSKLICNDGTVIKISDETEKELRKAFGPKKLAGKKVQVYALNVTKNGNIYQFALSHPYPDTIFPEGYLGRSAFTKSEIEKIIAGLQNLIEDE